MQQLGSDTVGTQKGHDVLFLLDRVRRMHPECSPSAIVTGALFVQVRHLASLPLAGGWMMRFLRELPTCGPLRSPAGVPLPADVDEDIVHALDLRRAFHGNRAEPVYLDCFHILHAALAHVTPQSVCSIVLSSYERHAPGGARLRRTS